MELPKNQLEQLELERKANDVSPIRQNFSGIGCLQGACPSFQTSEKPKMCQFEPLQTPKNVQKPPVSMLFPLFGAHVGGAEFLCSESIWRGFCGIMANVVAQMRCRSGTNALPNWHKCATELAQVRYRNGTGVLPKQHSSRSILSGVKKK